MSGLQRVRIKDEPRDQICENDGECTDWMLQMGKLFLYCMENMEKGNDIGAVEGKFYPISDIKYAPLEGLTFFYKGANYTAFKQEIDKNNPLVIPVGLLNNYLGTFQQVELELSPGTPGTQGACQKCGLPVKGGRC